MVPHLHEAEAGGVLLLHQEEHRPQNLLSTLLRTVETDLGLGHLEQITQAQEANLSLKTIASKPAADDEHNGGLAYWNYLSIKLTPETAILAQSLAPDLLLPDQFGSWLGSRRGPPALSL